MLGVYEETPVAICKTPMLSKFMYMQTSKSLRTAFQALLVCRQQAKSTAYLHTSPLAQRDSTVEDIKPIFDDGNLWRSASLSNASKSRNAGLFGQEHLRSPESLAALAERTVEKASVIVDRICALPQTLAANGTNKEDGLVQTAKQFDRLSDLLCGVIDFCEFARNVHPDAAWVGQAHETYEYMSNYMNQLNTHVGLYTASRLARLPIRSPADRRIENRH